MNLILFLSMTSRCFKMNKQTLAKQLVTHLKQLYGDRTSVSVASLEEINMGWETELCTFEVDVSWKITIYRS